MGIFDEAAAERAAKKQTGWDMWNRAADLVEADKDWLVAKGLEVKIDRSKGHVVVLEGRTYEQSNRIRDPEYLTLEADPNGIKLNGTLTNAEPEIVAKFSLNSSLSVLS